MTSRCRRAFTLVELLVVIGIVAVLVSLLMPVLAQLRQRADATVCASNIRQIVLAMSGYEADYKKVPPIDHPCFGTVLLEGRPLPKCWVDALLEMHYLAGPDLGTRTLGVLGCPAVEDSERWVVPLPPAILSRSLTDYGYNFLAHPGWPESEDKYYQTISFRGQRGRMARGPDKILMIETWYRGGFWDSDGTSRVWPEGHGWYGAAGGVSATGPNWEARHMRGRAVTVAYMDSHVELLYPPPWPYDDPAAAARHPLSDSYFTYTGPEDLGPG